MINKDVVLELINEIIDARYGTSPSNYYKNRDCFIQGSYKMWAIYELKEYIFSLDPNLDIMDAVESFRDSMDVYACRAKTFTGKITFSVAYDVATDVLDALIILSLERTC